MAITTRPKPRRRLSMTSLIDVIFLLLLFFMLSSTFSRFGTVDLMAAEAGQGASGEARPLFLRLSPEGITLNGAPVALGDLKSRLGEQSEKQLLLSIAGAVTSQSLVDVLAALRGLPGVSLTVLG